MAVVGSSHPAGSWDCRYSGSSFLRHRLFPRWRFSHVNWRNCFLLHRIKYPLSCEVGTTEQDASVIYTSRRTWWKIKQNNYCNKLFTINGISVLEIAAAGVDLTGTGSVCLCHIRLSIVLKSWRVYLYVTCWVFNKWRQLVVKLSYVLPESGGLVWPDPFMWPRWSLTSIFRHNYL